MNLIEDSGKRLTESSKRNGSVSEVRRSEGTEPRLQAPGGREEFWELLHGLNNVLVSVLLNAQLIEWRLPSYSGMRRSLHEVERSARRGAGLVNRLKDWLEEGGESRFQQPQQEDESAGVLRRMGETEADGIGGLGRGAGSEVATNGENSKKVSHTMV